MKTGLFFGSFNPIHLGHLLIANYFHAFTDLDSVWFVVSPQNPLKKRASLLPDYQRYELVVRALQDDPRFRVSDIEFHLPRPSYTIDTLSYLGEKHPGQEFVLIMGSDNLGTLKKWKNYEILLEKFQVYVYPRHGEDFSAWESHPGIRVFPAPRVEISSSFIREAIREGKDMRFFLPSSVYDYITEMNFYRE